MSNPGCGIIFSPSQRIDRRNSLRRSFVLNPKSKRRTSDRTTVTSGQCNDSYYSSHTHTRSLSDKMRRMQMRSKREQELQQPLGALRPAPTNAKRTPKHVDLLEAASQTDCESLRRPSPGPHQQDVGTGKENVQVGSLRTKPRPFNGDQSYRQIAYKKYMSNAFGLASGNGSEATLEPPRRPPMDYRPGSDASALTMDSMDVNFHISDIPVPPIPSARDRRPKIQVQIPGKQTPTKRPTSTAHLATQIDRQKSKRKGRQSNQVSPPTDDSQDSETPARLSVVSPLSVMEMPKPRRPFSALSLEDMTQMQHSMPKNAPLQKSETSDSSDTGNDNDKFSAYSRRSSMSSLTSVATVQKPLSRRHSIAFSIADPIAAGVFDSAPPMPKISNNLRAMQSVTSLAPNTNKPLPPEPGLEEVQPLRLASQSYSRGSDLHPKRKAPSPLTISRSSTVSTIRPNRMSSLRSKYTPADLDALDAAFVKSSPQVASFSGHSRGPSWEQAQNALEEHLDTIAEDDAASGIVVPLACDPLQISRMTGDMMPTRHAPAPPPVSSSASIKLSDGSVSSRKKLQKQPSKHVVMQMKGGERNSSDLRNRISAPVGVGGNLAKANRILGKSVAEDHPIPLAAVHMEREVSNESNWSSSDSPDYSYSGDSSSPNGSNRGDTTTPETDVSSIPDHAFEEIRNRMELLSPKNDSPTLPISWGLEPSPGLPIQEHIAAHTRPGTSDEDKPAVPDIEVTPSKDDSDAEADIAFQLQAALPPAHLFGERSDSLKERPRSLASIAASEIPDIYAQLPASETEELSAEEAERLISADAAEIVLLRILEHLDNLQDLFATATVSRGFYRTFKRHELPLMKNALYGMSPAAWELREVTLPYPGLQDGSESPLLDYSPSLYLQHYMRDMYTMIALKSMILIHCESFLRADTITALAGGETVRASQIDDAFWRVWTFCQVFGCGSNREDDIIAQMDWLRGGPLAKKDKRNKAPRKSLVFAPAVKFGHGNADGLSAEELYDMTEIWTCMGVLVRGFQGKREEAREYGVFDNAKNLNSGDVEAQDSVLEEWTYHLLTLAPPTVLDVTSPNAPTAATFAHARTRGYTTWTPPPTSRATFLKEAVSRIYQERIAEVHPSSAPATPTKTVPTITLPSSSSPDYQSSETTVTPPNDIIAARWRCARHAAEIRAKRSEPGFDKLPPSEDRPMSNYPSVLEKLDGAAPVEAAEDAPPVPSLPATTFSAEKKPSTPEPEITSPVSGGGHKASKSESDSSKTVISALVVPKGPQVRDPVDVAVERLVSMGFESKKAKKALAESDTGNNIDFECALERLVRERKRDVDGLMHYGYRGGYGSGSGVGGTVREQRRRFEEQHAGMGRDGEGMRPSPLRVGSVRRLASQMEGRGCAGSEREGSVGLGIGGVAA